jgi:dihydrofolate reductase
MAASPTLVEPKIALIVARARNGVIGRDGGLPWKLKADLRQFKEVTLGKPVVMGRKTWESLPFPLPGRANLVLSRDPSFRPLGAETSTSFEALLARAGTLAGRSGAAEIMVIGGEALFDLALPIAERIYLTEVDAEVAGDVFFPQLDEAEWVEVSQVRHEADADNDHAFTVRVLERAD